MKKNLALPFIISTLSILTSVIFLIKKPAPIIDKAAPPLTSSVVPSSLNGSQEDLYYVSPEGNDTSSGKTRNDPFRTIQHAIDKMGEGDICYLLEGVYRESLIVKNKRHISLRNLENAEVIVTGLDQVQNWIKSEGGIFKAKFVPQEKEENFPWHLNEKGKFFIQVFSNGQLMPAASFPDQNGDLLDWDTHGGDVKILPQGKFEFEGNRDNGLEENFFQGGIFHAIVERKWNAVQGTVSKHPSSYLQCTALTKGWEKSNQGVYNKNLFTTEDGMVSGLGKGFIYHSKDALDSKKEWFWDKNTDELFFIPQEGTDPNGLKMEARSRKFGITISNSSDIEISGIKLKAAGVQITNSNNCTISDCQVTYATPFYLHDDEFNGKAMVVIKGGKNNTIKNSYIAHNWGSGIEVVGGYGNIVDNNLIEDVNWMGTYNGCVRASGTGTKITNNTLRRSGRFLIHGIGMKNGLISNNHMYDAMLIGQDGGAFYTYIEDGAGTQIAFNWIHNVEGIPWERSEYENHNISVGVYLDGGCQNFDVHHNVIWNTEYGIMYNASEQQKKNYSKNNSISYNTIYARGKAAIVSKNLPALYVDNKVNYNLVNKKIGALSEKQGNKEDFSEDILSRFFKKDAKPQARSAFSQVNFLMNTKEKLLPLGAYEHSTNVWKCGADPSVLQMTDQKQSF